MRRLEAKKQVEKSAVTGQFVSSTDLKKHPKTTYKPTVSAKNKPKKKG